MYTHSSSPVSNVIPYDASVGVGARTTRRRSDNAAAAAAAAAPPAAIVADAPAPYNVASPALRSKTFFVAVVGSCFRVLLPVALLAHWRQPLLAAVVGVVSSTLPSASPATALAAAFQLPPRTGWFVAPRSCLLDPIVCLRYLAIFIRTKLVGCQTRIRFAIFLQRRQKRHASVVATSNSNWA